MWTSNNGEKFTIIGKTDRCNSKQSYIYCLCRFEDGYIVEADFTNINKGNIKNPNYPSVCGVGYIGQGSWKSKHDGVQTREYSIWLKMMQRCYGKNKERDNPSYKDVYVCERWKCFQNFCEDLVELDNYDIWKDGGRYELDKDILCTQKNIVPKMYSKDTCMFISKSENVSEATKRRNLTGLTYIGISPYGEKYEFKNQKEFSEEHNLNMHNVNACILNKRKSCNGWKFKIKQ